MALFVTVTELARMLGARSPFGLTDSPMTGVSIDSRSVEPGHLFVGLKGTKCHGQRFARKAFENGACAVLVEDEVVAAVDGRVNVLVVPSTELALQQAAREVRARFDGTVIAVTGTNGKTTTKQVAATVLEELFGAVHASPGNLNNHLGLPLSLLSTPVGTKLCVFELGMSNPGEIDFIASIAKPSIGVITNVGGAHLETMRSVDAIIDAKAELIRHLPGDGLLLLNADCPNHKALLQRYRGKVGLVGVTEGETVRGLDIELLNPSSFADSVRGILVSRDFEAREHVSLPIAGVHTAGSFLFASLLALRLGACFSDIPPALARCRPAWGRMDTKRIEGVLVINDGYNANPSSMDAALRHLASIGDGNIRRWAVLGEMLELGPGSAGFHFQTAVTAIELLGVNRVFFLGDAYGKISERYRDARLFSSMDEIANILSHELGSGDVLLLKASRGIGIERLISALFGERGNAGRSA